MPTALFRVDFATAADIPALLPLMEGLANFEHYRDTFAVTADVLYRQGFARQPPPDFYCLVARHAEGQLGECWCTTCSPLRPAPSQPSLIKELFVHEAYRGHRVGEELMRAVAQTAVAHGCGAVRWAVAKWNEAGRRFYERPGAQANPVWMDYSLRGDSLVTLADLFVPH